MRSQQMLAGPVTRPVVADKLPDAPNAEKSELPPSLDSRLDHLIDSAERGDFAVCLNGG